jgi:hypothetical protein
LRCNETEKILRVEKVQARWAGGVPLRTGREREKPLAIFLSVLSVACFAGSVISRRYYDSRHFDLLILSAVIFLSAAIPSFGVDTSLEELKSVNQNLLNIQAAIEKIQQK